MPRMSGVALAIKWYAPLRILLAYIALHFVMLWDFKQRSFGRRCILVSLLAALGVLLYCRHLVAAPLLLSSLDHFFKRNRSDTVDIYPHPHQEIVSLQESCENRALFDAIAYLKGSYYDEDAAVVGTTHFTSHHQYQRQPYVLNGYIGARIPVTGLGFAYDTLPREETNQQLVRNGWPLFNHRYAGAFVAGFFDSQEKTEGNNFPELLEAGWELVISAVPQWTTINLRMQMNGKKYAFNTATISKNVLGLVTNYTQSLSLEHGSVTTRFVWLNSVQVTITVIAHRDLLSLGLVEMEFTNIGNKLAQIEVESVLDFSLAQRCAFTGVGLDDKGIHIEFRPEGIDYVHGAIYSQLTSPHATPGRPVVSDRSALQKFLLDLAPGQPVRASKTSGIITSDWDPEQLRSREQVLGFAKLVVAKRPENFADLFDSHRQAWNRTLSTVPAITFHGDRYLTLAARASLYHLVANTRPHATGVTSALSVVGLSSDSYAGHVFWDTDLWISNAIAPFSPANALSLPNYRLYTRDQAKRNLKGNDKGAVYPWTSGRFGNCTATGPCYDYEYHINFDVAQSAWNLYLSGATDENYLINTVYPLMNDAAEFYASSLVKFNDTVGKYTTRNMTDPDEYANHVDNGAFTNAAIARLMKWHVHLSQHLGAKEQALTQYQDIAKNIYLPQHDDLVLEYSGMNSSVRVKQADVIMLTYPLENELINMEQAQLNMEFYAAKQVSFGPAMTYSIFSILGSKIAASGCASYSYLHKSIQPFLRGPFAQMSEQNNDDFTANGGTHPAFPFLTGHGGFVQAALQGLTGWRYDYFVDSSNKIQRVLVLDPVAIPCLEGEVVYDGLHFNNNSISMVLGNETLAITNKGQVESAQSCGPVRIRLGQRNEQSNELITVPVGRTVHVQLHQVPPLDPASIAECQHSRFVLLTEGSLGSIAMLMHDGDNSTHWQPRHNSTVAKVFVDLKRKRTVSGGYINWGERPPKHLKVSAYAGSEYTCYEDFAESVAFAECDGSTDGKCQNPLFTTVFDSNVTISAPFDPKEFLALDIARSHNITVLGTGLSKPTQFLLLEFEGVHNTEPIDDDTGGAKLYEVVFYE